METSNITPAVTKLVMLISFLCIMESCKKTDFANQQSSKDVADLNALPHTKQFSSEVATAWFVLLTDIVRTKPYGNPTAARLFAYSGLALYESVVPGMPSYQSMYKHLTGNTIEVGKMKDYYWPASANAAIARIAQKIMQNYANPNLAPVLALEASQHATFQAAAAPEQLQASIEFGRAVADKIYELSITDGALTSSGSLAACPLYVPLGGPGNWVPTPNGFFPAAGACQGNLKTFIPNIVFTALAPPPIPYSTDPASAFYAAANEAYLGSQSISTEEIRVMNNWRDILGTNYTPLAHTLRIVTEIIFKEKLNLEEAAMLFAKQGIATSDAVGAVFHSKFQYALLRPVTYVRSVLGATTWNSVSTTPQHPSYPDELGATASSVAILENYFGSNYAFTDSTQKSLYGSFTYTSLNDLLLDVGNARTKAGITFGFCADAGAVQGRLVGELVDALPFKKL